MSKRVVVFGRGSGGGKMAEMYQKAYLEGAKNVLDCLEGKVKFDDIKRELVVIDMDCPTCKEWRKKYDELLKEAD